MKEQGNKLSCCLSFSAKGFEINLFGKDRVIMKSAQWKHQNTDRLSCICSGSRKKHGEEKNTLAGDKMGEREHAE